MFAAPVTVAAGFFTSYTDLAAANTLRDIYAASILNCFWRNVAKTSWCDDSDTTVAEVPKSATIPANTLVSLLSQIDADALALALAAASRVCVYTNELKNGGDCAAGTTKLQAGQVLAGTIKAGSVSAANTLAQTLADALNTCVLDSVFATSGTAGSQGPSGNCTTNCGAYYS